ncbi:MAG TPA: YdcF family protein [Coleofasciculaceae cyanobacterium]
MEVLIGLALLWVLWLISSRQWKRRLVVPLVATAAGLLIVSPLGLGIALWGLTISLPQDSGEKVDAIVVLGRGDPFRDQRVATVQRLWQTNRAPEIFASGMLDARSIVQNLQEMGLPEQRLDGEECSQTTEENAQFAYAILHPQGIQTILLVTDAPHMLRSFLTFRSFGFHVIPHLSSLPTQLTLSEKFWIVLREYLGLIQYGLTGQLNPRPVEVLQTPPVEIVQKIRDWHCRVHKTQ